VVFWGQFRSQGRPQASAESADSAWQRAQAAIEAHDWASAKGHLSSCLETWPVNAEAHFLMARTCRRADDVSGWQRHLKNGEILQWPSEEIALERQLLQAQLGHVRSAEPVLVAYLEAWRPEEMLIYEAIVKGHLESGRLNDVLHWTNDWLERHPGAWQPHL